MAQYRSPGDQYMARLPIGMRDMLKAAAKANGRSLNSEIVHRLETWREPSKSSAGMARLEVDTTEVKEALSLVRQLGEATEQVAESCAKLGIKIGSAS